jgi:thymidylate synthase ThyX
MDEKLANLQHKSVRLKNGGEVIVLNTGAVINAESEAMVQALHSRDPRGLRNHLETLAEQGAEDFMNKYYVGYNHKSIGDCGSTTIFIEGVSMLAAKAVQDNMLYAGQETSTRYVDFSKQPFIDPTRTQEGSGLLEMQREFYMNAQKPTRELLRRLHPQKENEKNQVYKKAIKARAFDITRSLLPAGASTNLSWHSNLRQAADKLLFLRHYPLPEVKDVGEGITEVLIYCYPNSFSHKRYKETEAYQDFIATNYFYHNAQASVEPFVDFSHINIKELDKCLEFFVKRPKKTELPKFLGQIGTVDVQFQLDFGSFRDIQRQRSVIQRMPLLTTELGFNKWYPDNFPQEVREKLPEHLNEVNERIKELNISPEEAQYFIPMGYNVSNRFTGDLPALIYIVELRNSRFVHPTLQKVAHSIGEQVKNTLGVNLHVDPEPSRFDIKRGEQDIVMKK